MNKNIMVVLVGGFVIAILVAVLVQASLGGKKKAEETARTEILVAARDLKVGTEIGEADVKWQDWPESMVFAGAVRRTEKKLAHEAVQGRVRERVAAGQPIHKNMLVDAKKNNMLAATLRPGYRAVGIPVSIENIAGGLIGAGDYVDVLMTYRLARTGNSPIVRKFSSETILENVRILGIDNKSIAQDVPDEGKKKARSKQTVTLEVNPVGAEKIALASEMGDITLSLRPLGEGEAVEGDRTTTDVGLSKVLGQMVSGSGGGQVRVYNGAQVQLLSGTGSANNQLGLDDADVEGMPDMEDAPVDSEFVPPGEMLDAVREGIADGISRGIQGRE